MPRILITSIKQVLFQKRNGWPVVAGLCWGLSQPGLGLWPLAWVAFVPAFYALGQATRTREALAQGFWLGAVAHLISMHWLLGLFPMGWLGFPDWLSAVMAGGSLVVVTLSQGLLVAIVWALMYRLLRCWPGWGWLGIPVLWVAGFWLLNQNPIGLPWSFLAYSQVDVTPVRLSTYVLGFWGLEALMVLCHVGLLQGLVLRRWAWLMVLPVVAGLIGWAGAVPRANSLEVLNTVNPVVVQGNLPIQALRRLMTERERETYYQGWVEEAQRRFDAKPLLLIMPEGVVLQMPKEMASPFHTQPRTVVLAGGTFFSPGAVRNGALLYRNNALEATVAKRVLVPFGETTPFIPAPLLNWLFSRFGSSYGQGFTPAQGELTPMEVNGVKLGPLICFEALHPQMARRYRELGSQALITLGNLAWFHQHPVLEAQFLAINRFRAAETGLPVVVSANTGVSAFISPRGDILSRTRSGQPEFLTVNQAIPVPEATRWRQAVQHTHGLLPTQFMDY